MRLSPAILRLAALTLLCGIGTADLGAAERGGTITFEDVRASDRSLASVESGLLRGGPRAGATILSRTGLHLFVAESELAWNEHLGESLMAAIEQGPGALESFARSLDPSIAQAGPEVEGGLLHFELPDRRGEGALAVWFPMLLDTSRRQLGGLDAAEPNEGLYVAGVDVDADRSPSFRGLYLPSRPKSLTGGRIPDMNLRELPGGGEGSLAIFRGKGAPGSDGDKFRDELRRLLKGDSVSGKQLRDFPKDGDLVGSLRRVRAEQTVMEIDGDWYKALSWGPEAWDTRTEKAVHPSQYVVFSAPVGIADDDGKLKGMVVLGGVAWYTPLMLRPDEARWYVNKSAKSFFGSVQRGELPFFRDDDDVFFYRGHLDAWRTTKNRQRRGRGWSSRDVSTRIKEVASKARSRNAGKAAGEPMPMRFEPRPDVEKDVTKPPVRGRVFDGDLVGWLRNWDRKAEFDGPEGIWSLTGGRGVRFEAGFELGGKVVAAPPKSTGPLLSIKDVYPVDSSCSPGTQVRGVVQFVVDRIPDGEEAALRLEWFVSTGGPALARLSASLVRVAGEHEVVFEGGCPSSGPAELGVILSWPDTGLSAEGKATVRVGR